MKNFFKYQIVPANHLEKLIKIEPKLIDVIDLKKPFNIRIMPDHFQCFVHTIISQQLSSAAVDTIWNKMVLNLKKITPKIIANSSKEILELVGLSPQKISLLKQFSYDIVDKKINLKKLNKKTNEEITDTLIKYKYVGQWTIDMLLIFTYYRNNVLPISDYGIINGIKKLYPNQEITSEFLADLKTKLGSYATLFSFCMWTLNKLSKNTK